jgi:hypothetical protein
MSVGRTFGCHHPRKRMIQYAAAFVLDYRRHGVLDRPVKPGDDNCVLGRTP